LKEIDVPTAIREHSISSASTSIASAKGTDWRRIWLVGLLAIVVSVAVNWLVDSVLVAVLPISPDFDDLQVAKIEPLTVVGSLGAVLAFALVCRFSSRPVWLYRVIASVVLALSGLPDLALLAGPGPGATPIAVSALFLLHVTTYLVCVSMLTTWTHKVPRFPSQ
jgi:Family of unknown function (DUF6069)